jgi:hypothetical protein
VASQIVDSVPLHPKRKKAFYQKKKLIKNSIKSTQEILVLILLFSVHVEIDNCCREITCHQCQFFQVTKHLMMLT